jgi:8-oxo-dGTP pyrophosphatase MutT (NUDIX family)
VAPTSRSSVDAAGAARVVSGAELVASLARGAPRRMEIAGFRRAAVLVPVLEGTAGLELLLTVRAGHLRTHAGQIAFPGGRLEEGEDDVTAALRETREEIGLDVRPEQVIGRLSDHPSPAGYVATPLVALLPWPERIAADPSEVAETFTVPVADLLASVPTHRVGELRSYRRRIYTYRWREREIWGFTGNVVHDLLLVLGGATDVGPGDPFEP